ncbi:hypothetical protein NM688_g7247 [Phlebia brevispora]|uniref:Uncharacterized protein n=1 Tax=Phlebia brevispora TaxID=194682 RepID=A0ACC1S7F5_9APHY|nr:hypothetical protein NM688_g7247 [Phlebia brevispora]
MVHLMYLGTNDPVYREAERRFRQGWKNKNKTYHIEGIFYIIQDGAVAQQHLANNRAYLQQVSRRVPNGAEQYLFHGTQRACHIGDDRNTWRELGPITCSAEASTPLAILLADGYVWNDHMHSKKHTMFLSNVVVGRTEKLYRKDRSRTAPSPGFDSVVAVTKSNGGSVNNPETVVYREDAILPSVVIVYTRKHH